MLRICFRILLIAGCIFAVGCSRKVPGGIVRGTVTHKNKPLGQGTVVFYRDGGGQMPYGNVQKDGTFQLLNQSKTERIEPGKYSAVIIAGTNEIAQMKEDPSWPVQPLVPTKFANASTTPLKFDVVVGENSFDINLDKY
jgi:hypothetical protein